MKSFIIFISILFSSFLSLHSFAQTCSATSITPYTNANGGWSQTASASISSGAQIIFGPHPSSGGSWAWSGCGTSGSSREQTVRPTASCTAQAVYTNSCGATSTQNFTVTVSGGTSSCNATAITPYISVNGNWSQTGAVTVSSGATVAFGPQPASGGSWTWSGCGTSGSSREQVVSPTATCTAQAVHTNSCGATSRQNFTITVNSTSLYRSYNTNPIAADMTGMGSNAVQLASKIKLGVNIGNTMEAHGCTPASENCWGNPNVTAAYIKLIKDSGFDAVRIPLSWDQYANQSTAEISTAWLDRVRQVVQWSVDNGLYVVVNIHWDGGWLEKNFTQDKKAAVNAKQKAYWEQIATKLRDFDEHVIFASANEPDAETAADIDVLDSYHQTFVDAVRSTGGKNAYRVLVLQAPKTNIDKAANEWNRLPSDTATGRQMVEVHFYDPFNFTLMEKDETWGKMSYYWGRNFHSTTDTERNSTWGEEDHINAQFAKMKTKFVDRGIPVVVGEFAAMLRTQLTGDALTLHRNSRAYFHEYVAKKALENGLLPFVWEIGVNPGLLFNRTTPAVGDWQLLDALLIGSGKAVVLSNSPQSWNLSDGAANTNSTGNMQFTLSKAWSTASYNLPKSINWTGANLVLVLNFDQAFINNRNGGTDGFLQFFTYSNNWAANEFRCWTDNKQLVAGQDTTFTCSDFTLQNAVAVGIQFPGTAGTVTIKGGLIKGIK